MKTYQKKTERIVTEVFNDVFDKYDLMNDIMSIGIHRYWKRQFINWLNPQQNTKLIDVASGTGDIGKLFLERVKNNGHVFCVDENKEMLNLSKEKFKNSTKVKWHHNKAENLPFKDNSFDYYTISFGIRNVANVNFTLQEAYRVLKPGGRFLCLEFSKVKNIILNKFYQTYSKSIPKIGKIIVGKSEPYEYLIDSIGNFYNQKEFLNKIEKQNFSSLSYKNFTGGIVSVHSGWKL